VLTPFVLSTPSLSESNPAVPIELQRAALSPGVQASESQLVVAGLAACVPFKRYRVILLPVGAWTAGEASCERRCRVFRR
jgi:hypothetical protein